MNFYVFGFLALSTLGTSNAHALSCSTAAIDAGRKWVGTYTGKDFTLKILQNECIEFQPETLPPWGSSLKLKFEGVLSYGQEQFTHSEIYTVPCGGDDAAQSGTCTAAYGGIFIKLPSKGTLHVAFPGLLRNGPLKVEHMEPLSKTDP